MKGIFKQMYVCFIFIIHKFTQNAKLSRGNVIAKLLPATN